MFLGFEVQIIALCFEKKKKGVKCSHSPYIYGNFSIKIIFIVLILLAYVNYIIIGFVMMFYVYI